ncbi:MAG: TlpA disulfide reductase family protein [Gaiellaceae bacterium]
MTKRSQAPAKRSSGSATPARRGRVWWAVGVLAVVALVTVATVRSTTGGSAAEVTAVTTPGATASVGSGDVGAQLSTYVLVSIDGEKVKVPAGKPGALFFMAGWCYSCVAEAVALDKLERRHGERISVLAISPDPTDTPASLTRFRQEVGARYPYAWDKQGTLARALGVRALDTTVIYDARGKVVFRDAVPSDLQTLEAAFRKAGVS